MPTGRLARWSLVDDINEVESIVVFSGGACNIMNAKGKLLRNEERDDINDWLTRNDILFYDPQIHPDTHGMSYSFEIHQPLEVAARQKARVNLFEISPLTFGGATALEIALDEFRHEEPTIIFFSDGDHDLDVIPAHSPDGYPLFKPHGLLDGDLPVRMAHYKSFVKAANRMRRYFMKFAEDLHALTVTFEEESYEGDIVITPNRMHAADLFRAIVQAASGQRTIVNFQGGKASMDEKGYPLFLAPEKPLPAQLNTLLDQYSDEGNNLRREIAKLVRINVYSRVVYTQQSAKYALADLLRITGGPQSFVEF